MLILGAHLLAPHFEFISEISCDPAPDNCCRQSYAYYEHAPLNDQRLEGPMSTNQAADLIKLWTAHPTFYYRAISPYHNRRYTDFYENLWMRWRTLLCLLSIRLRSTARLISLSPSCFA